MRIHHVGYLVKRLERSIGAFESLGYTLESEPCRDEYRKIDIAFMTMDSYRVELVSPYSSDSVVAKLIKQYRNAPYHICYSTDDFDNDLKQLTETGFTQIDTPAPAPAIGGAEVVFLMSPTIGIVELVGCV